MIVIINKYLNKIRTKEMLKQTATRSHNEANEFHKQLIESHKMLEQLKEDNALLTSMKDAPISTRQSSDSFDKKVANELISKLQHEKNTLEQFLHQEQEKCSQFLQNAEINARKASHLQNENNDLKNKIDSLNKQIDDITNHSTHQMQKLLTLLISFTDFTNKLFYILGSIKLCMNYN